MKPFLEDLAEKIISRYTRLEEVTLVFPNRRAALFFRAYLTRHLPKPAWSPNLLTIEELFTQRSSLLEADRFSLIYKLFHVYRKVLKNEEPFDRFYFWGEMLLRDFDEVDKYLVPAATLFTDLSKLKELDETFDYLTEEQKKFLKEFWINFQDRPAQSKEEFLRLWRSLPRVYSEFVKSLRSEGLAYEGMIHRQVAEQILFGKLPAKDAGKAATGDHYVFAGFNALTKAEETLIGYFVGKGADIVWDLDSYYVNDAQQEAGQFFRHYRKHPVFAKTFDQELPTHFSGERKSVRLFGVPQKVGQAKLLGQMLKEQQAGEQENLRSVVVLPDESMLMAVMHSIPDSVGSVNVTMGYPLQHTPLNNLLELLLDLQIQRRGSSFNHQAVTAILGHAYILSKEEEFATRTRYEIIKRNRVFIPATELQHGSLLTAIFHSVEAGDIAGYLLEIVQRLGALFDDRQSFDREYAYHFHRSLSRLNDVLKDSGTQTDLKGFQKLFRQVTQSQRIPFTGEPLKGLQVMGVLETRSLDFDNVYILSLNEGTLPSAPRQGSYIPHGIRKAYGLPTFDHQDAISAYLFYRVLQRAKNVNLFYNTEPDIVGMGEMSRLLQQLLHESGWDTRHHILNNSIQLRNTVALEVAKTPAVMQALNGYTSAGDRWLSPSVINDYIECSLRFYLKHVAGLKEADFVEDELDARIFGNFVHQIMDWFYHDLMDRHQSREITAEKLDAKSLEPTIDALIERAYREHYSIDSNKEVEWRGQAVLIREIVSLFIHRILELDQNHAPFRLELVEEKKFSAFVPIRVNDSDIQVRVSGRIDRVDSKDGQLRVIDYKTGKDESTFDSIGSLFQREGKRNKAAFQTILYSWLYVQNAGAEMPVSPILLSRANLFKEGLRLFVMGKTKISIDDIRPYLDEFIGFQKEVLRELFNPEIPFSQTTYEKSCTYCLYKEMCRR